MSSEIPLEKKKIRSQILDKNLNGKNIIRHHNFPIYSALLKLELKSNAQFYIVHFNKSCVSNWRQSRAEKKEWWGNCKTQAIQ